MSESGIVRSWNSDEGWGVVDVGEVDDGVWVHFSSIEGRPFGILHVGEPVTIEWEDVKHPPYSAQATRVVVDEIGNENGNVANTGVMSSRLTIEWDADRDK